MRCGQDAPRRHPLLQRLARSLRIACAAAGPAHGRRYFTVNVLNIYGNATNIRARTHGGARDHLIVHAGWDGEPSADAQVFRVATPTSGCCSAP